MSSPEDGEHQRPELILTLTSDPLRSEHLDVITQHHHKFV